MKVSIWVACALITLYLTITHTQQTAYAQNSVGSVGFPSLEELAPDDGGQTVFRVRAADDGRVEQVLLFYKYQDQGEFRELSMQRNQSGDLFSVRLPENDVTEGTLNYYYIAKDNDGNISTEGFIYQPLKRQIQIRVSESRPAENPQVISSSPLVNTATEEEPEEKGGVNLLYIGLGILAVGALAGLAGDSGGSDSATAETVPITVTTPVP